jgi:hypothetical protein
MLLFTLFYTLFKVNVHFLNNVFNFILHHTQMHKLLLCFPSFMEKLIAYCIFFPMILNGIIKDFYCWADI